ncbi:22161_t:CDS:2, partial [Racocetra persica]
FTKMELFPGHIASLIPVLRETTNIHSIDLTSYNSYIFAKESGNIALTHLNFSNNMLDNCAVSPNALHKHHSSLIKPKQQQTW